MFRSKLYQAFALLLVITLVQAALAIWASGLARYHVERSRVANEMLAEFIALGADKQRLKVWLAQYLLVKEAPLAERDRYLLQMQQNLTNLNELLVRDQQLAEQEQDYAEISQQLKSLSILETNVAALERSLKNKEVLPKEEGDVWRILIQTFDNLEGLDLKRLIAASIDLQRTRSALAESKAEDALNRVQLLTALVAGVGVICAVLLALLLSRALYRPIQQLLHGTSAIAYGQLDHRLPEGGHSEFSTLARSFNQMAMELQRGKQQEEDHTRRVEQEVAERTKQLQHAIEQLQQAEQMQQRFLADVSHELRTPATAIRGEAEIGLRGLDKNAEFYKETLARIVETSVFLSKRIDDLLMLVRGPAQLQLRQRVFAVSEIWSQFAEVARRIAASQNRELQLHPPVLTDCDAQLFIDHDKLTQVLQIVLDNAFRYSDISQLVSLELELTEQCCIRVRDHGIGIPEQDLSRVGHRYFRAANARKVRPDGLGIGLSLCHTLLQAQHGEFNLKSREGQGTVAEILLPLVEHE
ncbi:HAMP domain-containing protein [Rheinheimera mesophila]|uniref:histidine kinase n=1 Tax=Rheinheimera mesophila TaxID=1547515 RepID=A0A3P3QKZ6_9GAMM|nr:ATP-binding protein [Rheinheimera mesophila]KKL02898.1 histidine kinase [Rheinheimera mesophila]RRJ21109.1 HAMP domain-containing protein [Rheinheimera mesophila]